MAVASASDSEIDFVILWVDACDPAIAELRASALAAEAAVGRPQSVSPRRHRDNGELLFLLRSITANMPWYRRIYLVTNGQRPPYLDLSSDRICLIRQDDIFPSAVSPPSFNTHGIDACVHLIDGLSETFVRFADDFVIGKPVSKSDFLGVDGLGRHLVGELVFNKRGQYYETLQRNAVRFWQEFGFLPLHNFLHVPQLRRRSIMREMIDRWSAWFEETRQRRFRDRDDANCMFLYPYFSLHSRSRNDLEAWASGRPVSGIERLTRRSVEVYEQVMVGAAGLAWRAAIDRVARKPPQFFNINDDQPDRPDPGDVAFVGERMTRLFPRPSPFETNPETFPGYARAAADIAAIGG